MRKNNKALYIAYLTGAASQTVGLFYFGGGVIAGIDLGMMQYDGSYSVNPDGSIAGTVEYVVPAGSPLITGLTASVPTKVPLKIHLSANFGSGETVSFETPFGPVNARFEKLKELP